MARARKKQAFHFTARSLPPIPSLGQIDYWDATLPGFGMRVSAGGTRTWIVMYRYNGTKRRLKLGNYPAQGLATARDEAKGAMERASKGLDPASERRVKKEKTATVDDLATQYIDQYAKVKKRSWYKDEQILNREVLPLIGRKRISDVSRQDIRDVLKPIVDRGSLIRANHTLEVVRKMFNWSLEVNDEPAFNPAVRLTPPGKVEHRKRCASSDHLRQMRA